MKFVLADSCSDAGVDRIRGRRSAFGSPIIVVLGQAKSWPIYSTLVEKATNLSSWEGLRRVAECVTSTLIKSPASWLFRQTLPNVSAWPNVPSKLQATFRGCRVPHAAKHWNWRRCWTKWLSLRCPPMVHGSVHVSYRNFQNMEGSNPVCSPNFWVCALLHGQTGPLWWHGEILE